MNKFQKLAQLNKDIELLENAGKIKAADILHQKFIKEAQYGMPQMMPMMMPQMMMPQMMPQMMMARPQMPVAPAAVPRPVAPVAQPAPVAAPAPKPAPVPIGETPKPGTTPAPPPPPPPPTGQTTTPPGGVTYQVNPPQTVTMPPTNDQRFDYYNGKIFKGYEIEDPRQRQQYLDKLKEEIRKDGKLDPRHKEIFDDMFAGG